MSCSRGTVSPYAAAARAIEPAISSESNNARSRISLLDSATSL